MPIKETAIATKISLWKSFLYLPFVSGSVTLCKYFSIDCELMALLIFAMFLDFISGWYKSFRLEKAITLKRFLAGFYSKVITFVILLALGIVVVAFNIINPELVQFFNLHNYISWVMFIMILNELYSIFGNIKSGKTKIEVKEIDFITMFMRAIRKWLEKVMTAESEKIYKDIDNE